MNPAASLSNIARIGVTASAICLFDAARASAECPAGHEQRERAAIVAYYNAEYQAIYQRRDQRFREALIRYETAYASAAKPIYAELHKNRAALAERIRAGDLRYSTQGERSSEALQIGRTFRQEMSDLTEALTSQYNADLASIRDEVAEDRAVWLQRRTQELRNLNIEIQEGCKPDRKIRLRTLFEWVGGMARGSGPSEQPPALGCCGTRG